MSHASVIVFPGTNGDFDVVRALKLSGFQFIERIWFSQDIPKTDLIVIPGGFAYGDYLRAGAIAAFSSAMDSIRERAAKGVPILGICNGFQILLEANLLEGTLLTNKNTLFTSRWVQITVENACTSFTGKYAPQQVIKLPCAHFSGMYFARPNVLKELEDSGSIIFRYAQNKEENYNFNGSQNRVAGVINKKGNVMGLMPHPERAIESLTGSSAGLPLFESILS